MTPKSVIHIKNCKALFLHRGHKEAWKKGLKENFHFFAIPKKFNLPSLMDFTAIIMPEITVIKAVIQLVNPSLPISMPKSLATATIIITTELKYLRSNFIFLYYFIMIICQGTCRPKACS